ncbi:MAG: lytic polysaccharide monooxygenase [Myxococcaceae bacterium]
MRPGLPLLLLLIAAPPVFAHARLTTPTPRSTSDAIKDTGGVAGSGLGPCMNGATAVPFTTMQAGSTITVNWDETINHPGCFLLSIKTSEGGAFEELKNVKHVATGPVPNQANPRKYTTTVTLPNVNTTRAVFLMRQIMLADDTVPCPPNPILAGQPYYSCADLILTGGDGGTMPPVAVMDAGTPTDAGVSEGSGGGGGMMNGMGGGSNDKADAGSGANANGLGDAEGCNATGLSLLPGVLLFTAGLLARSRRGTRNA